MDALCPGCNTRLAADALQCRKCGATFFGQIGPKPIPIATEADSASVRRAFIKAGVVFARFLVGTFTPALIYGAVLSKLIPWGGGAPEYKSLDIFFVVGAGLLMMLVNSWVPFISWKTIPNAFFAGMLLPCLALLLEGYWSDFGSRSRYQNYGLVVLAVPVATCVLFIVYKVWGHVTARLHPNPTLERDVRESGARPSP